MPELFDVIRSRRTVRSFTSEPVSDADLKELIDLAILAPTGMNAQPWRFTIVTDKAVMAKLNARIKETLKASNADFIRIEGLAAALNNPDYSIFYNAPALIALAGDLSA